MSSSPQSVPHAESSPRRGADRFLNGIFLVAIVAPSLWWLTFAKPAVPAFENRAPATFPAFALRAKALAEFPQQFEAYFNDCMGFRGFLLACQMHSKNHWFRVSSSPNVLLGRHGRLFLNDKNPFNLPVPHRPDYDGWVQEWCDLFEDRHTWLADRGIRYLVFFAPDSHSVYPELLPRQAQHLCDAPLLDALLARLKPEVALVDVRSEMRAAKAKAELYIPQDTHWNDEGAWVGYHQVLTRCQAWFPELRPTPREGYQAREVQLASCDLAQQLGRKSPHGIFRQLQPLIPAAIQMHKAAVEGDASLTLSHLDCTHWDCPNAAGANCLVLHDSFGDALLRFLQPHFAHGLAFPSYHLPAATIEREKPRLVLQELVERTLKRSALEDVPGVRGYRHVRRYEEGKTVCQLPATNAFRESTIALPATKADRILIVRVEVEATEASTLRLSYPSKLPTRPQAEIVSPLTAGAQSFFLVLSDAVPGKSVELRTEGGAAVKLRALEMREVPTK